MDRLEVLLNRIAAALESQVRLEDTRGVREAKSMRDGKDQMDTFIDLLRQVKDRQDRDEMHRMTCKICKEHYSSDQEKGN